MNKFDERLDFLGKEEISFEVSNHWEATDFRNAVEEAAGDAYPIPRFGYNIVLHYRKGGNMTITAGRHEEWEKRLPDTYEVKMIFASHLIELCRGKIRRQIENEEKRKRHQEVQARMRNLGIDFDPGKEV